MNISDLYQKDGGSAYHSNKHAETDRTVSLVSQFRARKFRPYVSFGDEVLEYGVGAGWNLRNIECAGKTGFDVSTWLQPLVEKQGIKFVNDIQHLPKKYFDVVICHHVLEHVPNPMETLKEIKNYVKPGGLMLLFVPTDTATRFNRYNPNNKDHHLFTWNVQTLCNLVVESGFTVKKFSRNLYGFDRFISHSIDRFRLPSFLFYPVFYLLNLIRPDMEIQLVCKPNNEAL